MRTIKDEDGAVIVERTRAWYQALGRQGGLVGGKAAAASMTRAQRKARARRAANARWARARAK